MSGAVTNTSGLGAAQQLLSEHVGDNAVFISGMGYALSYPFGIIGIIIMMVLVRIIFNIKINRELDDYNEKNTNKQKLENVMITVANSNLIGHQIGYIRQVIDNERVVSRCDSIVSPLFRNQVDIPRND